MLKQKLNIDTFLIPQLNTKRALKIDTSSDSEESHINKWRRLSVIHGTSEAFSLVKLNPFVIEKGLDYLAGRRAPMINIRDIPDIREFIEKSGSILAERGHILTSVGR